MEHISLESILIKVSELEQEYQESKGLILTEDDLKCHLFSKLNSLVNGSFETMDSGIRTSPLHSELKFFDEDGELKLRPDLCIIEPNELSILHSVNLTVDSQGFRYESTSGKEFEFSGNAIIIELKFCKNKRGINRGHIRTYEKDIEKIKRLQNIINTNSNGRNEIIGIFIVFNKTNIKSSSFEELLSQQTDKLKIIYGSSNLFE